MWIHLRVRHSHLEPIKQLLAEHDKNSRKRRRDSDKDTESSTKRLRFLSDSISKNIKKFIEDYKESSDARERAKHHIDQEIDRLTQDKLKLQKEDEPL